MTIAIDERIDATGLCCPLPLVKLAMLAKKVGPGRTIEVTGNDPIFERSIGDFCKANGHDIVEVSHGEKQRVTLLVRIKGA